MAQKTSKNFSFIGGNIKKIRKAKNISQADFAKIFNLGRASVGAYEEGRSEPKIETIIQIANYFRLSIDVLLQRELTVADIYSFGLVNEKLNKAHSLSKADPTRGIRQIPFVRMEKHVEYIVQRKNNDFISRLPKVAFPNAKAHQRAFEVSGGAMEHQQQGINEGDVLIAERIYDKSGKEPEGKVVVVITGERIMVRRLRTQKEGTWYLQADNPRYGEIVMEDEETQERWVARAIYSTKLLSPSLLEYRVSKLEELIKEMLK